MRRKIELEIEEEIEGDTAICSSQPFKGQFRGTMLDDDKITYVFDALCKDGEGKIVVVGFYKVALPVSELEKILT